MQTLYRWLDEYNKQTTPSALSDQKEEIAKLKKELAQAKMENEILKKAAIYFANQAR
jgi:transposase-like protein